MKFAASIAISFACSVGWLMADEISITKSKDEIEFKVGKEVVTRYHVGQSVAKPYFWPLLAKGDIPVTRAWPMKKGDAQETTDHVHQKSAWFCHGDVIAEGLNFKSIIKGVEGVDFWAEVPGHGKIVCIEVGEPSGNKIATKNEWRAPDGTKIMDENRTISLQTIGDSRLIVLEIELIASVYPITFADTKEGAMGVRVHDHLRVERANGESVLINAEGKKIESGSYKKTKDGPIWGYQSAWCDYSGKVNNQLVGIAIFDDPANKFASAWHARGYGLMAANPFGRNRSGFPDRKGKTDLVKLNKGESLKLRYGMYVHTGNSETGKVSEAFKTFAKGQ